MTRWTLIVSAFALMIHWIVGLSQQATPWMTCLEVPAMLFAFLIAGGGGRRTDRRFAIGAPIALAAWLLMLFGFGLATSASTVLTWWTFAFACVYLAHGIGAVVGTPRLSRSVNRRDTTLA